MISDFIHKDLKEIIKCNPAVLLYISSTKCNICKVLQPKIQYIFDKNFPKIKQFFIDIEKNKATLVDFNIFTAPTILIFLDGKEFVRKNRNVSIDNLAKDFQRPYDLFFGN